LIGRVVGTDSFLLSITNRSISQNLLLLATKTSVERWLTMLQIVVVIVLLACVSATASSTKM